MSNNYTNETLKKKSPWLFNVRNILYKCGLNNIWYDHYPQNTKWLRLTVKQKLQDLFINEWYSQVDNSSNSTFYRIFKKELKFESYLSSTPKAVLPYIIRFRTRNHRLPIETGNWARIPINLRTCNFCNDKIGDELHYLLECPNLIDNRKKYIKPYYYRRPNTFKMEQLINTTNRSEFLKLCKFMKTILLGI